MSLVMIFTSLDLGFEVPGIICTYLVSDGYARQQLFF